MTWLPNLGLRTNTSSICVSCSEGDRPPKGSDDGNYSSSVNEAKSSKKRRDEDEEGDERDDSSTLKKPRVVLLLFHAVLSDTSNNASHYFWSLDSLCLSNPELSNKNHESIKSTLLLLASSISDCNILGWLLLGFPDCSQIGKSVFQLYTML